MQNGSTLNTFISWIFCHLGAKCHFLTTSSMGKHVWNVYIKRDAVKKWLISNGFTVYLSFVSPMVNHGKEKCKGSHLSVQRHNVATVCLRQYDEEELSGLEWKQTSVLWLTGFFQVYTNPSKTNWFVSQKSVWKIQNVNTELWGNTWGWHFP
jgi:hypothetical protein